MKTKKRKKTALRIVSSLKLTRHCRSQISLLQSFVYRPQYRIPHKSTTIRDDYRIETRQTGKGKKKEKSTKKNTIDPTHVHIALEPLSNYTLAVVLRLHHSS